MRKWVGLILSRWVYGDDELSLSIEVGAMASYLIDHKQCQNVLVRFWFSPKRYKNFPITSNFSLLEVVF